MLPEPTVERLSRYRRVLRDLHEQGQTHVFSHDLAELAHSNPAQVRRDVMLIGHTGSPAKGYRVKDLRKAIAKVIEDPSLNRAIVVGLGNLGRAVVDYFGNHHPRFTVAAAFDVDPEKVGSDNGVVPAYDMEKLEEVIEETGIKIAILTIPAAATQAVADRLYPLGVTGIVNFAPVPLKAPKNVFVEQVDIAATWEKVAYFARRRRTPRKNS